LRDSRTVRAGEKNGKVSGKERTSLEKVASFGSKEANKRKPAKEGGLKEMGGKNLLTSSAATTAGPSKEDERERLISKRDESWKKGKTPKKVFCVNTAAPVKGGVWPLGRGDPRDAGRMAARLSSSPGSCLDGGKFSQIERKSWRYSFSNPKRKWGRDGHSSWGGAGGGAMMSSTKSTRNNTRLREKRVKRIETQIQ